MKTLLTRYDLFKEKGLITHLTTNLSAAEIESIYGNRLRSRMREMFNLFGYDQNSTDKRKWQFSCVLKKCSINLNVHCHWTLYFIEQNVLRNCSNNWGNWESEPQTFGAFFSITHKKTTHEWVAKTNNHDNLKKQLSYVKI